MHIRVMNATPIIYNIALVQQGGLLASLITQKEAVHNSGEETKACKAIKGDNEVVMTHWAR